MGRTNERIARVQETYVANATTSWLESLERSLAQMKEYQVRGMLTYIYHCRNLTITSLHERNWRVVGLHMMLLLQRCKKRRKKTSGWKKSCGHKRPSMKRPARMSIDECKTSKKPRSTVSLILLHSSTLNWDTMIGAAIYYSSSSGSGQLGMVFVHLQDVLTLMVLQADRANHS